MENEENNQTTQQHSSESSSSKVADSSFLYKQIKHSFWLLWAGVGAFLITSISISIHSITQPNYVKNEQPEAMPVVTAPATTSSQTHSPVPLWLLVAAVGCTAGAIAIAKRRKKSVQPSPENQPPEPQTQSLAQEQILLPLEENLQIYLVEEPEELLAEEKIPPTLENQLLILLQELEIEENPTNTGTESLAEMLDIRKQLPLSAILGESYQQQGEKTEK